VRVANPEAVTLLGLQGPAGDLAGQRLADLTRDPGLCAIIDRDLSGAAFAETITLEGRTVRLHSTPLVSASGAFEGAVLLMSDITEQHRLEEAQRRFVADASHEMRTPISALKGLLELLSGGAGEDRQVRDDFLRTMTLEVDRLGRLVADLLILAQLDSGAVVLHREPVPVAELLADVATIMRPLAHAADIALVLDVPDPALTADCDRDRILQVLLGFVDNALKHSSVGGSIYVRAQPHGATVTLAVQDEGIGVAPKQIPMLFDRFFRVDESRAVPRGTGLGLSIAKEIIEGHGSTIEVTSQPGQGATFAFTLPIEP
jgi:signal transduction histidine kinase